MNPVGTLRFRSLPHCWGQAAPLKRKVVRNQFRFASAAFLFEFCPPLIKIIEKPLSVIERGLSADKTRGIGSVRGIFEFGTPVVHDLLRFFDSLLDGGVLSCFQIRKLLFARRRLGAAG